jgi:hypothetical protein
MRGNRTDLLVVRSSVLVLRLLLLPWSSYDEQYTPGYIHCERPREPNKGAIGSQEDGDIVHVSELSYDDPRIDSVGIWNGILVLVVVDGEPRVRAVRQV